MALIKCPDCGSDVATSAKRCTTCDSKIVTSNGKEWRTLSFLQKFQITSGMVAMGVFVSWLLVELLAWIFGGISLPFITSNSLYWWSFGVTSVMISGAALSAFHEGEMNS